MLNLFKNKPRISNPVILEKKYVKYPYGLNCSSVGHATNYVISDKPLERSDKKIWFYGPFEFDEPVYAETLDEVYEIKNGRFKGYFLKTNEDKVRLMTSPVQGYYMGSHYGTVEVEGVERNKDNSLKPTSVEDLDVKLSEAVIYQMVNYGVENRLERFEYDDMKNVFSYFVPPKKPNVFGVKFPRSEGFDDPKDFARIVLMYNKTYQRSSQIVQDFLSDSLDEYLATFEDAKDPSSELDDESRDETGR